MSKYTMELDMIQRELNDLERKQAQLAKKVKAAEDTKRSGSNKELELEASLTAHHFKRILLILRDPVRGNLEYALDWLNMHGPVCYTRKTELITAFQSTSSPQNRPILSPEAETLPEISAFKSKLAHCNVAFVAFSPMELTRGCVSLIQDPDFDNNFDLIVITGCKSLTKHEYEDPKYTPLLEEIVLKEALQPVILLRCCVVL